MFLETGGLTGLLIPNDYLTRGWLGGLLLMSTLCFAQWHTHVMPCPLTSSNLNHILHATHSLPSQHFLA